MTEREIIRGCQREKAKYQRELVHRYSPMLMTVARRYCRDNHAAKDVLQEAFVRIFRAVGRYEASGSFTAWMRRIVINCALQSMDKMSYQREQTALEDVTAPSVSPDVYSNLGAEELLGLIQQLPDGFRDVFNLYVVEGYNHEEIAKLLKIAPGTSRSQLVRARKRLQAIIKQRETESYVRRQVG